MEYNKENYQYTWYPENTDGFYEIYDNLEEMIKIAKKEYDSKTGVFYGCDDRYSPIINIGTVEYINNDSIINACYYAIQDTVANCIDDFSFGLNAETECYYENGTENKVKEKIKEIIECLYLYPSSKSNAFKGKYDLINNKWINE